MKTLKYFLIILLGRRSFFAFESCPIYAQSPNPEGAFHGMLVMGSDIPTQSSPEHEIYIHHLPMFAILHRFQGLWKISFGEQADRLFHDHRNRSPNKQTIYMLVPKTTFALRELMDSQDSFRADLFHGHFERGGEVLIPNITVQLLHAIHWHEFNSTDAPPESTHYIVFGQGPTAFLAHLITVPPTYDDQNLEVSAMPPQPFPEGATIVFPQREDWVGVQEDERSVAQVKSHEDGPVDQRLALMKVLSSIMWRKRSCHSMSSQRGIGKFFEWDTGCTTDDFKRRIGVCAEYDQALLPKLHPLAMWL